MIRSRSYCFSMISLFPLQLKWSTRESAGAHLPTHITFQLEFDDVHYRHCNLFRRGSSHFFFFFFCSLILLKTGAVPDVVTVLAAKLLKWAYNKAWPWTQRPSRNMELFRHPEQLEHTILSKLRKIAHGDVTALSKETSRSCVITNRYVTCGALHDCTLTLGSQVSVFWRHIGFLSIQRAPLCAGLTWEQRSVEQHWTLSSLSLSHTTRIDRNGKKNRHDCGRQGIQDHSCKH